MVWVMGSSKWTQKLVFWGKYFFFRLKKSGGRNFFCLSEPGHCIIDYSEISCCASNDLAIYNIVLKCFIKRYPNLKLPPVIPFELHLLRELDISSVYYNILL